MPPLGINCLDSFFNFRNRKKPKSSKQKIPAFFIWTKLPLFLLSISHSSRFPFLLTPIPPLLPIFPFFTPPHPIFSHAPFSLFQYTPFFLSFLQHLSLLLILHFPLLHLIPFSSTSPFLYSNTPHSSTFPFPIFQHLPPSLFHPMFSFLQNQTTCTAQKYLFSKIQNQKIPLSFPNAARPSQNHHLLFPYKKNKRSPRFTKNAPFSKFSLISFSR